MIPATIIDTEALWQTIWTSAASGVVLCVIYAVAVLGATKSSEAANEGHRTSSVVYAALGVLCLAATLGFAAYGIILIAK